MGFGFSFDSDLILGSRRIRMGESVPYNNEFERNYGRDDEDDENVQEQRPNEDADQPDIEWNWGSYHVDLLDCVSPI